MLKVPITNGDGIQRMPAVAYENAQADLLYIYKSNSYINEKGYLQKLVELLFNMGYYVDNKSIFNVR